MLKPPAQRSIWEVTKTRALAESPAGLPYNQDPNKVPLISETPIYFKAQGIRIRFFSPFLPTFLRGFVGIESCSGLGFRWQVRLLGKPCGSCGIWGFRVYENRGSPGRLRKEGFRNKSPPVSPSSTRNPNPELHTTLSKSYPRTFKCHRKP